MSEAPILSSRSNPRYRLYRGLFESRNIKKHGLTLVGGRRLVQEFLHDFPDRVDAILLSAGDAAPESTGNAAMVRFAPELFAEIDQQGTGSPLLAVRVPELPEFTRPGAGLTVYLPLSDPENLGAALRTSAAFGAQAVVLLKEAAHPFHPRAIRAAAGEAFHLQMFRGPSIEALQDDGTVLLFALDAGPGAVDVAAAEFPPDFGLLVGEEGRGVPESLNVRRLAIALADERVESLNAAVAFGIAMYAISRRRPIAVKYNPPHHRDHSRE